jgi:hypothetical protein
MTQTFKSLNKCDCSSLAGVWELTHTCHGNCWVRVFCLFFFSRLVPDGGIVPKTHGEEKPNIKHSKTNEARWQGTTIIRHGPKKETNLYIGRVVGKRVVLSAFSAPESEGPCLYIHDGNIVRRRVLESWQTLVRWSSSSWIAWIELCVFSVRRIMGGHATYILHVTINNSTTCFGILENFQGEIWRPE